MARRSDDPDVQWRRDQARRFAIVGFIAALLIGGGLFVYWIYRSLSLGKVGDYYKQADEIDGR